MNKTALKINIDKEIKDSFSIVKLADQIYDQQETIRLTYNRILIIERGNGKLQIDEASYRIKGMEVFLLGKGQLFTYPQHSTVTGYELSFGNCFWERTKSTDKKLFPFNTSVANQHMAVTEENFSELLLLFEALYLEFDQHIYVNQLDALAAYLKIIMIKIKYTCNLQALENVLSDNSLCADFIELLSKNYQLTHEVARFAEDLGVSGRRLTDSCKKCTGKGAKDMINDRLIDEAKRSLQFSAVPVKEIAFTLNFATAEQFTHFFKKHTQISPNEYRELFVSIGR